MIINDMPYGTHERQKLDLFIPENPKSTSGLLLYIHGGGWTEGDKRFHVDDCRHFSDLGYITATMNYRFVSDDTSVYDELDDITSALESIKKKCSECGFLIDKLILSGGSAGGQLSLLYAYIKREEAPILPVAVCPYCPPVDLSASDFLIGISSEFDSWKYGLFSNCCGFRMTEDNYMNHPQQQALKKISPITYVTENCVPTAVFAGKTDDLIPIGHIEKFVSLLNEKGVKNDFLIYENSGHLLDKNPETAAEAKWIILKYIEMYFN